MGKVIMVIDDSSSFRTVVRLALQKAGYIVQEAGDGQEAIDKLPSVKPSLIVCDVNMPNLDGLSFARYVRGDATFKSIPIIMLTSESQESKREEGKAAGVRAWITKPFQPSHLVEAVKRFCP